MDLRSLSGKIVKFKCHYDIRPCDNIGNLGFSGDVRKLGQSIRCHFKCAIGIARRCFRLHRDGITYQYIFPNRYYIIDCIVGEERHFDCGVRRRLQESRHDDSASRSGGWSRQVETYSDDIVGFRARRVAAYVCERCGRRSTYRTRHCRRLRNVHEYNLRNTVRAELLLDY